jgi:hypothetical protein
LRGSTSSLTFGVPITSHEVALAHIALPQRRLPNQVAIIHTGRMRDHLPAAAGEALLIIRLTACIATSRVIATAIRRGSKAPACLFQLPSQIIAFLNVILITPFCFLLGTDAALPREDRAILAAGLFCGKASGGTEAPLRRRRHHEFVIRLIKRARWPTRSQHEQNGKQGSATTHAIPFPVIESCE